MNALDVVKRRLSLLSEARTNPKHIDPITVYSENDNVYLLYTSPDDIYEINVAQSRDGYSFRATEKSSRIEKLITDKMATLNNPAIKEKNCIVENFTYNNQYVMYYGERSINVAYSKDLRSWTSDNKPVIVDANPTEIQGAFATKNGIIVLFFKKSIVNGETRYSSYMALFNRDNPKMPVWQTTEPIWNQDKEWITQSIRPISSIFFKDHIISYYVVDDEVIYATALSGFQFNEESISFTRKAKLTKHHTNPVITPNNNNSWEAFNTFNPAATFTDGKVHILYRAQGYDYISSVGYAKSSDGIHIEERLEQPAYSPSNHFDTNKSPSANYDFCSGGGIGGCEDPRTTIIGDKLYMVYVAFDGWSAPRLAMTSILLEHFLQKRWLWSKPVLISPPGIIDKSGCLLPEKINGQYIFLHRVFPNILVDYVDDLNFDGKTKWLKGQYKIPVRQNMWDSRKIGAGAPPLKTKDGWLLIYYGVDDRDASKYHIGAMLLDLQHPEKVLYRTDRPILQPEERYENEGFKPGIAYPCGAVIIDDKLLVYYGGADSVVCVATANLNTLLEQIKTQKIPTLERIQVREVTY